ncbi:DDE family transposase [Kitasatospora cineracea]|uniref:DDE family transposase n=1 Tax=Kitasatospora cineracea TaxID=88074 RepID=A0A8G1UAH1_9ACTN|nr:DDE family transposase [Kitasatospora cineracea]
MPRSTPSAATWAPPPWHPPGAPAPRAAGRRPPGAARRPAGDHPRIERFWADQGFAGRLVEWTARILGRELDIVRKAPGQRGFQVQPKRWAIGRTFSWLTAHRRLARDYETSPAHSETMIRWAMTGIMVRRLTRGRPATRPGPRPLSPTDPQDLKGGLRPFSRWRVRW